MTAKCFNGYEWARLLRSPTHIATATVASPLNIKAKQAKTLNRINTNPSPQFEKCDRAISNTAKNQYELIDPLHKFQAPHGNV
jgi:hypothetical protein